MPALSVSRAEQLRLFGRNFFKHPRMLGSLIPSSRFLINHLLRRIEWERARVIVEYGPGVGTISAEILRHIRPDAKLVLIETNREFVDFLRRTISDRRVHLVHGSAVEIDRVLAQCGDEHADYIISGIPYTTMPAALRDLILLKTRAALHPEGRFLVYQFTRSVLPYLRRMFGRVQQDFEPLNILPAHLFYCGRDDPRDRRVRGSTNGKPVAMWAWAEGNGGG